MSSAKSASSLRSCMASRLSWGGGDAMHEVGELRDGR